MPRGSRHRSHRSHKHSRDRSDSEEEENSRERKPREEEPAASSEARVSKDPELENRVPPRASEGKDLVSVVNGAISEEHGKKRKERAEQSVVADRWSGVEGDDYKRSKGEDLGPEQLDKSTKSKLLVVESKGRSSRRYEGSVEGNDESTGKTDSSERKSEKNSSRRESSGGQFKDLRAREEKDSSRRESSDIQYKDARERDRERGSKREREREKDREREQERVRERERGREKERDRDRESEREREVQDASHERSDDLLSRKRGSKAGILEDETMPRKDSKGNVEIHVQDVLPNSKLEKGFEKHMRRRENSEDKDKRLSDGRDKDEKRSSGDYHTKDRAYRDERHEDAKYRDKNLDNLDRERKQRNDKHRDEHSRDRSSDRYDNKHFRDEDKTGDSHYRDRDGAPVDDPECKPKDNRGKKRFSGENEDLSDLRPRNAKEPQEDVEKHATSKADTYADLPRPEYRHSDKFDSSPRNNRQKSSASSSAYAVKEHSRDNSKQADYGRRESTPEERVHPSATAGARSTASGVRDKVAWAQQERIKPKDNVHLDEFYTETGASTKFERTPRSDGWTSPNQLKERSPSYSDRHFSDRPGTRCSLDAEVGQKSSNSRDGERGDSGIEKSFMDDLSQTDVYNRECTPVGSSLNRTGHLYCSSLSHLPHPPPVRYGVDNPSLLGLYEDDSRSQIGDHKSYSRYKRSGDHGFGKGHGNSWKSAPAWASPVANGFIPLQHGPAGFHPAVPQFPVPPPLFSVRPSMDMPLNGIVSFHMHDVAESYPGHGRPFGWHNAVDQACPPHMQVWDGSNGVIGDESHIYGRPDWDQNRHRVGSRAWEMGADLWKGENGSNIIDIPLPKKDLKFSAHPHACGGLIAQPGQQSCNGGTGSECLPTESFEAKISSDPPPTNKVIESPLNPLPKKTLDLSDTPCDNTANPGANYLSRIDISPDLANPELYKKCTSVLGASEINEVSNFTSHGCIQNINNGSAEKMNSTCILNLLVSPTKDAIFQRAMNLYKKHEKFSVKFPMLLPICSGEKKESPEFAEEKQSGVIDQSSLNKTCLPEPDSSGNKETRNNATDIDADRPDGSGEQRIDFSSHAITYANGPQHSEVFKEECSVNLNRIHDSPENTH